MSKSIFNVRLSKSIVKHGATERLVADISDHFLAGIGNLSKIKETGLLDLVEDVCSVIEARVPQNNPQRINKHEVAMAIFLRLFPENLTQIETMQLAKDVKFYAKHGLKHIGRFRRLARYLKSLVCSLKNERSGGQSA